MFGFRIGIVGLDCSRDHGWIGYCSLRGDDDAHLDYGNRRYEPTPHLQARLSVTLTDELQLTSIEEVNLDQGAVGRLIDFGRLLIHGTGVNDVVLPVLADPVGLRRALQEAMGASKVVVAVPEAPPLSQSAA